MFQLAIVVWIFSFFVFCYVLCTISRVDFSGHQFYVT